MNAGAFGANRTLAKRLVPKGPGAVFTFGLKVDMRPASRSSRR